MNKPENQMPKFAIKAAVLPVFAALMAAAAPAHAIVDINGQEVYAVNINEDKFANIAQKLADTEERLARLYDVVHNIDVDNKAYTDAYINANLPTSDVMQTGDQFKLYNTRGSVPGATVTSEPIVRLGAGSAPKTTTNTAGQTVLDMPSTPSMVIDGKTYNFAGATNSGVIAVGDMNNNVTRKIGGVSAGAVTATSTEAVNGSQLKAVADAIDAKKSGFTTITNTTTGGTSTYTFTSPDGDTSTIGLKEGKNIKLTSTGNVTTIATADDLVANSLTTGNVKVSTTGIQAGNMKITQVAPGTISATSTDAVNGSQLNTTNTRVTNLTNEVAKGWNLAGDSGNNSQINMGETAKFTGDGKNISTVSDGANGLKVTLANDLNVGSVTTGGVVMNSNGINMGGKKITNLAEGTAGTDGVNVNQLNKAIASIDGGKGWTMTDEAGNTSKIANGGAATFKGDGKNTVATTDKQGVLTVALKDDIAVNSVTTGDVKVATTGIVAGDKKITKVAAGEVSATSTDAINGSQLHTTNTNVTNIKNEVAKGWNLGGDSGANSNINMGETVKITGDGKNINTVSDGKNGLQVQLAKNLTVDSVTTGNVSISSVGVNAGGKTITNVAPGVNGTDAVNVNQLRGVENRIQRAEDMADEAAGLAVAGAAMNIEYVEQRPGQWVTGVGVASSGNHTALAIGTNWLSENGKYKVNVGYGQDLKSGSRPLFKTSFSFAW